MNGRALFGGLRIGPDTSGNFRLSLGGQLAVRSTAEDQYVVFDQQQGRLIDVTGLTLDVAEDFIFRVPVQQVNQGDLILISE